MSTFCTPRAACAAVLALLAMAAPQAQDAAKPLIQNDRVTVWDVPPGGPAPATSPSHEVVTVMLANAKPEVRYRAKGSAAPATALPTRSIVVELQDKAVTPLPNRSGYPNAFPREDAIRVLENERVRIWDYTWLAGRATPMHFHDRDVVVTYLAEGALTSTDLQGKSVVNEHHFGYTKFNPRDRVHTELLSKGQGRAFLIELK